MARTSMHVSAVKETVLDPNKDCLRVTGLQSKIQAASTEDPASTVQSSSPSAPQGEEASGTQSANNGNPSHLLNTADPTDISSGTSERKSCATVKCRRRRFVYDPAEGLTPHEQIDHYRQLGLKMAAFDESRLKRIMYNQNSSYEDFLEAMYQLHTRFPKHKQGRAKNPWGGKKK